MKTSEKFVTVDIEINDRVTKHRFPIRSKGGTLMTHRLRRVLAGNITHFYDPEKRETVFFHYIGASWEPPYALLQEILRDRLERQAELAALIAGHPELAQMQLGNVLSELPYKAPRKAGNDKITSLVRKELDLRHELGIKLAEAKRLMHDPVPRPYEV